MENVNLGSFLDMARLVLVKLCIAKIYKGDLNSSLTIIVEHYILGLKIIICESHIMYLLEKFEKLDHDFQNLCSVYFGVFGDVILKGDGVSCCDVVNGFFSFVALYLTEVIKWRNAIFTCFMDIFIYF